MGGGIAGGCLLLIITAGVAFYLGKLKGNAELKLTLMTQQFD